MASSALASRISEPTEPEPMPMTGSSSVPSRPNPPVGPVDATDCVSYGAARPSDTGKGPAASEVVNESGEELQNISERKTWLLRLLGSNYSPYLLLENSGSVARDHLASERTFLAYVRTSLALASAGVALVQLFSVASSKPSGERNEKLFHYARPLGAVLVVVGILVLAVGFSRYFRIQAALISGHFPLARLSIIFISSAIALLVAVVFGILAHAVR